MTLPRLLLVTLLGCILLLTVGRITVSNYLATDGIDLSKIQTQADELKKENSILREKVYTESSYMTIAKKARAMGFVPMGDIIYVLH